MRLKPQRLSAVLMSFVMLGLLLSACGKPDNESTLWWLNATSETIPQGTVTLTPFLPPTRVPGAPILTPTPDAPRELPGQRSETIYYTVQAGDSLAGIGQGYGVSVNTLAEANGINPADWLYAGQVLIIPPPEVQIGASGFKIIPDSELVYGPVSAYFNVGEFVEQQGGYLSRHWEVVDEMETSGAAVLERVAQENSVNPRLLLAVLEYQSGWVTGGDPSEDQKKHPLATMEYWRVGLYHQLSWAANALNRGYYLWRAEALGQIPLADGSAAPLDPTLNAGTAGVQYYLGQLYGAADWQHAVSEDGLFATYQSLFGYPFDLAIEPLIPEGLSQPTMVLPFNVGETWSFTGGPHGGWTDGSGWAALDFAPPGEPQGCVVSPNWVTAVADGVVVRSGHGMVVLDLDGDGLEQTGWTVLYLHVDSWQRAPVGDIVQAGDRIGRPSCEGGYSLATHLHIARRYNGEWISADGDLPFVMDGWVSAGDGIEYNGRLTRDGVVIEAWDRFVPQNQITR